MKFAEDIGYPIIVKPIADDDVHKSDTGIVKLNIQNKDDAEKNFDELMKIFSKGLNVIFFVYLNNNFIF